MHHHLESLDGRVALITGAARRVGAVIARTLHAAGMNVVLHYRSSRDEANILRDSLNALRPDSASCLQCELHDTPALEQMAKQAQQIWQRLDVLVNNASSFQATPVGTISEAHWDELVGSNLKAPLFLSQAVAANLRAQHGCIINIADIHAGRPLKNHTVYSIAKAGLVMLTRSLARELGPEVRVNAVAPGAILWPETEMDEGTRREIINATALKRQGDPRDIARAVLFLIRDGDYISGEVLTVDGGRSLGN